MKLLGQGTYNSVYLDKNGDAIRVAEITEPKILENLLKAQAIVNLIYNTEMTPSIFKIIEDGNVLDTLPPEFGIYKGKNKFFIQKIEYLPYEFENMTMDHLFFLLWFMSYTSSEFGFIHKDLKENNLLIRRYPFNTLFKFKLGDKTFKIKTDRIPVVMDFDLGSTTLDKSQQTIGTSNYAPVETILGLLCGFEKKLNDFSYDFWSLGMTIVYAFNDRKKFFDSLDEDILKAYLRYNINKYEVEPQYLKYFISLFEAVLKASLIKYVLHGESTGPGYLEMFESFFTKENISYFRTITSTFKGKLNIPPEYTPFLKYLLSWDPTQRNLEGDPWRYLELFYPSVNDDFEADFTYER